ncbi:MAG: four helix bundle protein [Verrucomicrobia bacterium]|jgi:predicted GIY-YIG superfamily endonuclease|nr:four helix bundle protein [Verrucomicrobiota bacterium]
MYIVYAIESSTTGRIYIGQTRDFHARIKLHNGGHVKSTSSDVPWVSLAMQQHGTRDDARRYEAHFTSKLTDCDGENSETDSSLDFAKDCGYITPERHAELTEINHEVGCMLGSMLKNPKPFLTSAPDLFPLTSDP